MIQTNVSASLIDGNLPAGQFADSFEHHRAGAPKLEIITDARHQADLPDLFLCRGEALDSTRIDGAARASDGSSSFSQAARSYLWP